MLKRVLCWPQRLLRLASPHELARAQREAERVLAEAAALGDLLSDLLDEAGDEAPVIRIHQGVPPHLH